MPQSRTDTYTIEASAAAGRTQSTWKASSSHGANSRQAPTARSGLAVNNATTAGTSGTPRNMTVASRNWPASWP
ncbi:hypothetical protein [Coralloluteibacterium stylophorae]|uniref:hypothetical protein n=1 Tax=Coralloluteibacterium stylophorae TaxID=1776034 RepID=UPI003619378A